MMISDPLQFALVLIGAGTIMGIVVLQPGVVRLEPALGALMLRCR